MFPVQVLILFLVPALLSVTLTPWVVRLAVPIGALDRPNARKIHTEPTPRCGGLAVAVSFFVSLGALILIFPQYFDAGLLDVPNLMTLSLSLSLVLLLGLIDDLVTLSAKRKFIVQVLVATVVYLAGDRISSITGPGGLLSLGILDYPVTVLWVVGVTNAFNLIDGLDGLAAGIASIAAVAISTISFLGGHAGVAAMALVLAGATLGFLPYNFNPARIFLGDSGSLFIGFALSILSMRGTAKGSTAVAILVPVLALGLPIMETLLSMTRRLLKSFLPEGGGRGSLRARVASMFSPDRAHIHHRLLALGLSQKKVVLILYCVSCVLGICAFVVTTRTADSSLILGFVTTATFIGVRMLGYREMAILHNGLFLRLYDRPLARSNIFKSALHLLFIVSSYAVAYGLTSGGEFAALLHRKPVAGLFLVTVVQFGLLSARGIHRKTFHLLGIGDLLEVVKSVALAAVASGLALCILQDPPQVLRMVLTLVLDFYFLATLVAASLASYRILNYLFRRNLDGGRHLLIYGANATGALLLQNMLTAGGTGPTPVGFLDDDPKLEGMSVNGFPVYGGHWRLERLAREKGIREILLADAQISPEAFRRLERVAWEHHITLRAPKFNLEEIPTRFRMIPEAVGGEAG